MHDLVSLSNLEEALRHHFKSKPLLIGGAAMENYGIAKRGADIDLVVTEDDNQALESMHTEFKRDIHGDLGICKGEY
jgi:DNA polymerase sigma